MQSEKWEGYIMTRGGGAVMKRFDLSRWQAKNGSLGKAQPSRAYNINVEFGEGIKVFIKLY